jgi:hypothetical protein
MQYGGEWVVRMEKLNGCQIPCLPGIAEGYADVGSQPLSRGLKRKLAKPWNYYMKKPIRRYLNLFDQWVGKAFPKSTSSSPLPVKFSTPGLKAGDLVRVRSKEEIEFTLDRWKELKGCAFLEYMWQYCGTIQRVLKLMERFLDERDYKVKKCKGLVLLEGVLCHGTPVFGRCDRCCHFFWREEWLDKIDEKGA